MLDMRLVVIDPQNSFCKVVPVDRQQVEHDGELCVGGAWEDTQRLAAMVNRLSDKLVDINCTLDSHHPLHIAHPTWFRNGSGQEPNPFTIMRNENGKIIGSQFNNGTLQDVGEFKCAIPTTTSWTLSYLEALQKSGRYPHCIWPKHCLIGSPGHNVVPHLFDAFNNWAIKNGATVNYVTKGSNPKVEHFSAVTAEVIDPNDFTTQLNTDLIKMLMEADVLLLAGEAKSHCLYFTIFDIANNFANGNLGTQDEFIKKCVLLEDCTACIPGFETQTEKNYQDLVKRGLKIAKSTDF